MDDRTALLGFLTYIFYNDANAGMAKLVDALGLGPSGATHGGSSPLPGTIDNNKSYAKVDSMVIRPISIKRWHHASHRRILRADGFVMLHDRQSIKI